MQFNKVTSVNEILHQEITVLVSDRIILPGYGGEPRSALQYLSQCIDVLGEESAQAQGLNKIITTYSKFSKSEGQKLYLLKDATANEMKGEIIGFLKTGKKHLFLSDNIGKMYEVDPFCVLDFYVKLSTQRRGFGRRLFEFMLKDLSITIDEIAIDGPSIKMINFLKKNFGVDQLLRQPNNFAITTTFFSNLTQNRNNSKIPSTHEAGRYDGSTRSSIGGIMYDTSVEPRYQEPQSSFGYNNVNYINPSLDSSVKRAVTPGRFSAPKPRSSIGEVMYGTFGDPKTTDSQCSYGLAQGQLSGGTTSKTLKLLEVATKSESEIFDSLQNNKPNSISRGEQEQPKPQQSIHQERPSSLPLQDADFAEENLTQEYLPVADTTSKTVEKLQVGAISEPEDSVSIQYNECNSAYPREPHQQQTGQHERPSSLAIQEADSVEIPSAGHRDSRRGSQLTDRGHFDVKFYHTKLW